jgi:sensor histidine kinase YesM
VQYISCYQAHDDILFIAALLLKLEKRIAEVHIESKELGFTKPGPYIFELLADLNITHKTAPKLKSIVTDASTLLEEDSQEKSTSNICRLETMKDILDIIFRDGRTSHAKYYRVSFELLFTLQWIVFVSYCFTAILVCIVLLLYLFYSILFQILFPCKKQVHVKEAEAWAANGSIGSFGLIWMHYTHSCC